MRKQAYELSDMQLKNSCSAEELSFATTAELEPLDGIIGQERAVKALDFGLAVKLRGYNIYMSGPSGTGKTTYAQKFPMSLSCRVCFEQSYNGIDGDSASSTELYCILSSLAELPIRQDLAVTGSVNQRGEIQAIGGVTHKIEGFFELCKKRGLTGTQGVIIPASNVKDLVLNNEVVEAVKSGVFHIYPITHISQGMELLMETPAGEPDEGGDYPADTVHGKVSAKLKAFAQASRDV